MSDIRFDDVTKTFGDTVAVDHLDLDIADGEFLVLLGPSGCGKSTALRMLAGLETPTAGTISIGDRVVNDVDARHRDVAMVFQSYALYPHMTVAKNIESPLIGRRAEHADKAARAAQVRAAAEMLGLDDLLDRKPAQLSGGQRQRVALARAIVRRPAVFLMDEPLSNLDANLRATTRSEIVDLHRNLDTTFVYVTHDQTEALTMATRIAVLADGRLQQVGTPREIYEQPANVFVATFIGAPPMNLLTGRIASSPTRARVAVGGAELDLGDGWQHLDDERTVHVGVRPEHLVAADHGLSVEVGMADWLGHEQLVSSSTPDGQKVLIRFPEGGTGIAATGVMHLTAKPENVHLFDPASGARIERSS